jgi:hypothetical protein
MRSPEDDAGDLNTTPSPDNLPNRPCGTLSNDRANNWASHPWMTLMEDRLTGRLRDGLYAQLQLGFNRAAGVDRLPVRA